eukprot:scaffold412120_cov34-Prasinocladus_malaysianus.AAC.1
MRKSKAKGKRAGTRHRRTSTGDRSWSRSRLLIADETPATIRHFTQYSHSYSWPSARLGTGTRTSNPTEKNGKRDDMRGLLFQVFAVFRCLSVSSCFRFMVAPPAACGALALLFF